jgi:hypothetical protein
MSAKTANAVFGQRLSDPPAYVGQPAFRVEDHSGYTISQLEGMRGSPHTHVREALKQRHIDESWKKLRESEEGSAEETQAVVALSDIVFGDNEIGQLVDAMDANVARMAAQSAVPPAQFLGQLMQNIQFYGVVTDGSPSAEKLQATLELSPPQFSETLPLQVADGWQVLGTIGEDGFQ